MTFINFFPLLSFRFLVAVIFHQALFGIYFVNSDNYHRFWRAQNKIERESETSSFSAIFFKDKLQIKIKKYSFRGWNWIAFITSICFSAFVAHYIFNFFSFYVSEEEASKQKCFFVAFSVLLNFFFFHKAMVTFTTSYASLPTNNSHLYSSSFNNFKFEGFKRIPLNFFRFLKSKDTIFLCFTVFLSFFLYLTSLMLSIPIFLRLKPQRIDNSINPLTGTYNNNNIKKSSLVVSVSRSYNSYPSFFNLSILFSSLIFLVYFSYFPDSFSNPSNYYSTHCFIQEQFQILHESKKLCLTDLHSLIFTQKKIFNDFKEITFFITFVLHSGWVYVRVLGKNFCLFF